MDTTHRIACLVGLSLVASLSQAHERTVRARITSVEPVYQTVIVDRPVTTCYRQGSHTRTRVVGRPVERCTTAYRRDTERRVAGYWVEYRHRGRYHRIRTDERPHGRYVHVARRS